MDGSTAHIEIRIGEHSEKELDDELLPSDETVLDEKGLGQVHRNQHIV